MEESHRGSSTRVIRDRGTETRTAAAGCRERRSAGREAPRGVASKEAPPVEVDRLLTAADVAAIFQVHPKTVYLWADRGELAAVRLGHRSVRFRREDVDKLVADRLVPAGSE
jgi:excisionase family DNA binding protein